MAQEPVGPTQSLRNQAMSLAREALARDPHCVLAMNVLAICHWQSAFYGAAPHKESLSSGLEITQQALAIDPGDHVIYHFRGLLLHAQRKFDEAIANLRRAHEINSNDAAALAAFGWVEACRGDTDDGIARLQAALRHDPRSPNLVNHYVALSMACFVACDYARGLDWALHARAERNDYPPAIQVTLNHQIGLGRISEAKGDFELLQRRAPGYVRTRLEKRGFAPYRRSEDQERNFLFLRIAAGLEDPSAAEALR
jgi:adenylate cyclase